MNTNRNTDHLFQKLREMPDEISHDKIHQFILAQVAIGIAPASAIKGLVGTHKLFYKFYLNSIAMITTLSSVSLISIYLHASHLHKPTEKISQQMQNKNEIAQNYLVPPLTLLADTPTTRSTVSPKQNKEEKVVIIKDNGTKTPHQKKDSVVTIVMIENRDTLPAPQTKAKNVRVEKRVIINTDDDQNNMAPLPPLPPLPPSPPQPNSKTTELPSLPPLPEKNSDESSQAVIIENIETENDGQNRIEKTEKIQELNENNVEMAFANDGPSPMTSGDSLVSKLKTSLLEDHLITDANQFTFSINGREVKVNNKKLDKLVWEKYKNIIETTTHSKVNKKFSYELIAKGEELTINVTNYEDQ